MDVLDHADLAFPQSLPEFQRLFPDDAACAAYLEKARWDGSKVTMREWYLLTDLQKEKFISEYTAELKKQYQGAFEVLGLDYLKALNLFSYYSNEKAQSEPSTKFIDLLIEGQAKR